MAITASSTFTEVLLNRTPTTEQVQARWMSPDGDGYVNNLLTNLDDADLAILQEVYASADGFGSVAVYLQNYPDNITTIDELEPHGFWNPLDAGSYNRWIAQAEGHRSLWPRGSGGHYRSRLWSSRHQLRWW